MKGQILTLLKEHGDEILKDNKTMVISLEDGICTIEKGLDESPFLIKVDKYDAKFSTTVDQFLGIEK